MIIFQDILLLSEQLNFFFSFPMWLFHAYDRFKFKWVPNNVLGFMESVYYQASLDLKLMRLFHVKMLKFNVAHSFRRNLKFPGIVNVKELNCNYAWKSSTAQRRFRKILSIFIKLSSEDLFSVGYLETILGLLYLKIVLLILADLCSIDRM